MRIKDEIFCFAHLRWRHNGWASNILIVVDTGYAGIHHSKYWMPIHYDTIEDGQNKKSIFYSLIEIKDELILGLMTRAFIFGYNRQQILILSESALLRCEKERTRIGLTVY